MTYSCTDAVDSILEALKIVVPDEFKDSPEDQAALICAEIYRLQMNQKPAYNRFKVALDVQDAVNLRALAREFVKVVDQAADDTKSTEATWNDPAVVLFVNKFESLVHSNWDSRFSDAYRACQEKIEPPVNSDDEHIPELTDFEHESLRSLVRAYGGSGISNMARAMAADIAEEDDDSDPDYDDDGNLRPGVDHA
jgi:hypothetical protein